MSEKTIIISEKKAEPLVSVIIPVYNVEKYLKHCLDSILTNTYKNLEVICIDDGSMDHSLNILEFYKKRDNRVKIIKQKNMGPSAARNKGLDLAKGKYISFVDSDDYISYNAYEILTLVAEKHKLDITIFGANVFPHEDVPDWIYRIVDTHYHHYKDCKGGQIVFQEPSCRPFLWMHFIKRDLFEKPDRIRFDESMMLGEDQLFQLQYFPRAKNIMVIEDKLYNYRISRSGSLMQLYSNRKVKKVNTHLELVQKVIDKWKEERILEENEDYLVTWMVNFLYYSILDFPASYKAKYAKKIIDLFEKNNLATYLIAEWEMPRYTELKAMCLNSYDDMQEVEDLQKRIEREKYEISETLKSRAFKLGRKFTSKQERLNLDPYLDILD